MLAQSTFMPLYNIDGNHFVTRLEMKADSLFHNLHSSQRPYNRKAIAETVDALELEPLFFNRMDRRQHAYLAKDNSEWNLSRVKSKRVLFKPFYQYKSDFLFIDQADFKLKLNPVLHFEVMKELDDSTTLFINTRGIEARGQIGKKLGFYSYLSENQARFPTYSRNYILGNRHLTLPGENRFNAFRDSGVDYFSAAGYISFPVLDKVNIQFGHDHHFFGNGFRSLILSNFAGNYLFLKAQTNVWIFQYTNLFAQMITQFESTIGNVSGYADGQRGRKYMALHHLSMNIGKKFNLGIFEAVMSGGDLDIQYLNPIIFYRAIETQTGGSLGNVIIGADFKYLPFKKWTVYGQLVLDEWSFESIRSLNGDWKNKNGFQLGIKTIDFLKVPSLDLQVEYNQVRPYTYTHSDTIANFTHYNQALAHPLGANFREVISIIRYDLKQNIGFKLKGMYAQTGMDSDTSNWGGNILLDYNNREQDLDNKIGQGIATDILYGSLTVSWQWGHNLFLDGIYALRQASTESSSTTTQYIGIGVRLNTGRKEHIF